MARHNPPHRTLPTSHQTPQQTHSGGGLIQSTLGRWRRPGAEGLSPLGCPNHLRQPLQRHTPAKTASRLQTPHSYPPNWWPRHVPERFTRAGGHDVGRLTKMESPPRELSSNCPSSWSKLNKLEHVGGAVWTHTPPADATPLLTDWHVP